MNKFTKVSCGQYFKDIGYIDDEEYDKIKLPARSTSGSAGYDFFTPIGITIQPGEEIKVMTGVKMEIDSDKFLMILPRSSLGFKYSLFLNNTAGIIDSDFFDNPSNEGHIAIKMTNYGKNPIEIKSGEAIAQGIILKYYKTDNDNSIKQRIGGIGSTNKNV